MAFSNRWASLARSPEPLDVASLAFSATLLATLCGPPTEIKLAPDTVANELREAGFVATILEEPLPDQYVVRAAAKPEQVEALWKP